MSFTNTIQTDNDSATTDVVGAAPATLATIEMAQIAGNTAGTLQSLPSVTQIGGRVRLQIGHLAMAAQAAGSTIHIARIPAGAIITAIAIMTTVSLGSATLALGDADVTAKYAAAATLTAINQKVTFNTGSGIGAVLTGLFDKSGARSTDHEDVIITTAAASLPASGTLRTFVEYVID